MKSHAGSVCSVCGYLLGMDPVAGFRFIRDKGSPSQVFRAVLQNQRLSNLSEGILSSCPYSFNLVLILR